MRNEREIEKPEETKEIKRKKRKMKESSFFITSLILSNNHFFPYNVLMRVHFSCLLLSFSAVGYFGLGYPFQIVHEIFADVSLLAPTKNLFLLKTEKNQIFQHYADILQYCLSVDLQAKVR